MRVFDAVFLIVLSVFLATRSPFSGVLVVVLGLLIQFQLFRMRFLLGEVRTGVPAGRRIRALALSLVFAAPLFPMLEEATGPSPAAMEYPLLLPLVLLVSLLAATMMAALAVEKRKR
jgi:hypothetical protein